MEKDKLIKDAQFRKGLSIAFFNATNNATQIIELEKKGLVGEKLKEEIVSWRNWLLEEHKNYYATVIANIGQNYKAEDSIKKLQNTKTLEELNIAWLSLSEDERRDGEIRKVAGQERKKYNEEI